MVRNIILFANERRMQRVLPHMRLILGLGFTPVPTQYQKVTLKLRKKKDKFFRQKADKKQKSIFSCNWSEQLYFKHKNRP
jgi:hypothetical protein